MVAVPTKFGNQTHALTCLNGSPVNLDQIVSIIPWQLGINCMTGTVERLSLFNLSCNESTILTSGFYFFPQERCIASQRYLVVVWNSGPCLLSQWIVLLPFTWREGLTRKLSPRELEICVRGSQVFPPLLHS